MKDVSLNITPIVGMGPPLPLIFSYENSVYFLMRIQLKVPIEIISFFSVCFLYDLFIPSFQQLDSDLYLGVLFFFQPAEVCHAEESAKKFFPKFGRFFSGLFFFFLHSLCEPLVMYLLDLLILPQEFSFYSLNIFLFFRSICLHIYLIILPFPMCH